MPSDLQYLTDENIEEIGAFMPHHQPALRLTLAYCRHCISIPTGGAMTHVEKMRFQAALQALRGTNSILLLSLLAERSFDEYSAGAEEGQATATGTE